MVAQDIRLINAYQESGRVFFHLHNGKTVTRCMEARDIIHANRIGNLEGKDAKVAEFVRLFNEKYAEPQVIKHVELSPSEQRFFQLHNERKICPLPPEDEEEYQRLLDE
jgi:hypothetical protein